VLLVSWYRILPCTYMVAHPGRDLSLPSAFRTRVVYMRAARHHNSARFDMVHQR